MCETGADSRLALSVLGMGKEVRFKKPAFKNKKKKVQKWRSKQNSLSAERENLARLNVPRQLKISEPADILKLLYSHQ